MKKIILVITTFFCMVLGLRASQASCFVYTEEDDGGNIDSLRYIIGAYNNFTSNYKDCEAYGSDASSYDLAIKFSTEELGYTGYIIDDNTIVLDNNDLDIGNARYSLVIGNASVSDGIVILDARTNKLSQVYDCKTTSPQPITLRNTLILTKDITKSEFLEQTSECILEGENLTVCPGDYIKNNDGTYSCATDEDEEEGGKDGEEGGKDGEEEGGKDGEEEPEPEPEEEDTDDDGDGYYDDDDGDGDWNGSTDLNLMDCDDTDASINPGAEEIPYDGIDQDCDGSDVTDSDGDGYDAAQAGGDDCDDDDAGVNPGATEDCSDGVDNDCDGKIDDDDDDCECNDPSTWYPDEDGDGYGDSSIEDLLVFSCEAPSGYVANGDDCDDSNASINPDADEICGDGLDNDCDGKTDEGDLWYLDSDGDGYGESNGDPIESCDQPSGYVDNDEDCDDTDSSINPAAVEACEDGVDNNCDGLIDGFDTITCQVTPPPGNGFDVALKGGAGCSLTKGLLADNRLGGVIFLMLAGIAGLYRFLATYFRICR